MLVIFIIFLILSLVLLSGRGSFLIAGYNTASSAKKARYDEKKLCCVTGAGMLVITLLIGISMIFGDEFMANFGMAFTALCLGDVAVMLYVMNTKCQAKDWDGKEPEMTESEKRKHKIIMRASIAFGAVVCIGVGILLVTGDITIKYKEDSFTIEADYWSDRTIQYADIQEMEYREGNDEGSRIGGFGSFRLAMGSFKNVEFGPYTRYTYTKCDAVVVLLVNDQHVVLNGKSVEDTKALYGTLSRRIL